MQSDHAGDSLSSTGVFGASTDGGTIGIEAAGGCQARPRKRAMIAKRRYRRPISASGILRRQCANQCRLGYRAIIDPVGSREPPCAALMPAYGFPILSPAASLPGTLGSELHTSIWS